MPTFMLEPMEGGSSPRDDDQGGRRLRNDSYLGAINKDIHIRAGLQVRFLIIIS